MSNGGNSNSRLLPVETLGAQFEAIGTKSVKRKKTLNTYEEELKKVLIEMMVRGVESLVMGDIRELPLHDGWLERVYEETDLKPV